MNLNFGDDIQIALSNRDAKILERDRIILQKDEQLNQKDEQLNQKDEQLNQKDEQIVSAIKMLLSCNMQPEVIAQNLNVPIEFVKSQM